MSNQSGLREPSAYVERRSEQKLEDLFVRRVSENVASVRRSPDELTGEVTFYTVERTWWRNSQEWSWSCECVCHQHRPGHTCCHKLAAQKAFDDPSLFAQDEKPDHLAAFLAELAELEANDRVSLVDFDGAMGLNKPAPPARGSHPNPTHRERVGAPAS